MAKVDLIYGMISFHDYTIVKDPDCPERTFFYKNKEIGFSLKTDSFKLKFRKDLIIDNKRYEIIEIGGEPNEKSI